MKHDCPKMIVSIPFTSIEQLQNSDRGYCKRFLKKVEAIARIMTKDHLIVAVPPHTVVEEEKMHSCIKRFIKPLGRCW